jgi:uncharacterized NAD(P)/FAD-binding protein YdhS
MATPLHTVVIIGGGFSGVVTAVQLLLCDKTHGLRVTLVDPAAHPARGLAYRFDDDNLLLNVPAGNMSALADDPGHFVSYCQTIDPSITACSFVSRRLYGDYLALLLETAQRSQPGVLECKADTATAIDRKTSTGPWHIQFAGGSSMAAEHVVLALGHHPPRLPLMLGADALPHVIDPWDFNAIQAIPPDAPVMVLGTGHTAVDALFNLTRTNRHRKVWMVSRHGLLPKEHRLNPQAPAAHGPPAYLHHVSPTARAYTRAVRQEVANRQAAGADWRDVLNELRPHTPQLWQALAQVQRRLFLRHLQPYWDVHRHRLAPVSAHRLHGLLQTETTQVMAARLIDVQHDGGALHIQLRRRGAAECETIKAAAIISCTGPNSDVNTAVQPLLKQLLQARLVQGDACRLGLMVTPSLQVLDANNLPVAGLWYVGPMLRAQHWEATAVPELRVYAQQLAQTLVACLKRHTTQSL